MVFNCKGSCILLVSVPWFVLKSAIFVLVFSSAVNIVPEAIVIGFSLCS